MPNSSAMEDSNESAVDGARDAITSAVDGARDANESAADAAVTVPKAFLRSESKWVQVRQVRKVQRATKEWWHPAYWQNALDEEECSCYMPISTMFKVACKRAPYYTLAYNILNLTLYFHSTTAARDQVKFAYFHTATFTSPWYTPITASVMHGSLNHILQNTFMLSVGGFMLEFTEGHFFMFAIHLAAAPIGFGFHGIESNQGVRGASGVIYAITWSQISLLVLNWKDLRLERYVRLVVLLILVGAEIAAYFLQHTTTTSYFSHLFGALVGIGISFICAKNVKVKWYEPILIFIAFVAHITYCIILFSSGQAACGAWGLATVPKLFVDTYMYCRASRVKRAGKRLMRTATGKIGPRADTMAGKALHAVGQHAQKDLELIDRVVTKADSVDEKLKKVETLSPGSKPKKSPSKKVLVKDVKKDAKTDAKQAATADAACVEAAPAATTGTEATPAPSHTSVLEIVQPDDLADEEPVVSDLEVKDLE